MAASNGALTPNELELAQLILETLNFDTNAEGVEPTTPLYGEGLGLDSIDILEISLAISKKYGIHLKSDDENNHKIFTSLRSLNEHIQARRTK